MYLQYSALTICILILIYLLLQIIYFFLIRKRLNLHLKNNRSIDNSYTSFRPFSIMSDGYKIRGRIYDVINPRAVIILVHGFWEKGGGKSLMMPHLDYLMREGYTCVVFDLRANGESEGNKITLGVSEWHDVCGVYDFIRQIPKYSGMKIGFMGISMGAATTLNAVGNAGIGDFVIAGVPFKSIFSLLKFQTRHHMFPRISALLSYLAFKIYVPNFARIEPINSAKRISQPLLLFGAKYDGSVPSFKDAKDIYRVSPSQNKLYIEYETSHDVYGDKKELLEEDVIRFLNMVTES